MFSLTVKVAFMKRDLGHDHVFKTQLSLCFFNLIYL
jgi:hypothetical protein